MMFWDVNGMGGWGYALMTISTLVFWALVIAGIVALTRASRRGNPAPMDQLIPPPSPEEVLAQRFARGEIDEHEYQQRRDVLRGQPRPVPRP